MKKTPLHALHLQANAKMVPYAGFEMPVSYPLGVKAEHLHVREHAGIFDVSHMGEFIVEGKEALDFLQHVTTNDVSTLDVGQAQYSCLPNSEGGIVDDLVLYRLGTEKYMMVVNGANISKDWDWLVSQHTQDCILINESDNWALLAVQGPKAAKELQKHTTVDLASIPFYTAVEGTFAGIEHVVISATGYTGSGGFELYIPEKEATKVWNTIMEGQNTIQPIGLAARDTLRLEMGYCLYGNDIDESTSPLEAGLGWITKWNKSFIAKDILAKQKEEKPSRRLVGLECKDQGIARNGYAILDADGNQIGKVTSGTVSPSSGKSIAMGYVSRSLSKKGSEVYIAVRKKRIKAEVVRPPFISL